MDMEDAPSPNFNDRKFPVDMLVLHYTGMATAEAAVERLRDTEAQVSSHYVVGETGRIWRLVPEALRAWHAGVSSWQGDEDLNSRSIGIEIANGGWDMPLPDGTPPPYPDVQIDAVIALCQSILARHAIPQARIVAHSDIAPARKDDPGEHFPWARLATHGIGLWPGSADTSNLMGKGVDADASGAAVERLQDAFAAIGYGVRRTGKLDAQTMDVVRAFQRRFVQDRVSGLVDLKTAATLERVRALYASSVPSS
ncbi:MAG: N-acetylmuramoyl-L-alanine amidase [Pseudomonadota bacterium]